MYCIACACICMWMCSCLLCFCVSVCFVLYFCVRVCVCVCVCLCTCLKVCVIVYVWCARACFTCVRNRDPSLCYSLIFFQQLKLSSIFPHAHAHGIAWAKEPTVLKSCHYTSFPCLRFTCMQRLHLRNVDQFSHMSKRAITIHMYTTYSAYTWIRAGRSPNIQS